MLITRLSLAELRLLRQWIDGQLAASRFAHLHLVISPSLSDPDGCAGSAVELQGAIRHLLHLLPDHQLPEVAVWVKRRVGQTEEQGLAVG